jgi:hypothetical protein
LEKLQLGAAGFRCCLGTATSTTLARATWSTFLNFVNQLRVDDFNDKNNGSHCL